MDYNEKAAANGLSLAALIFGILTVLGSCTLVVPVFTAPLAITFSWLSRGKRKMCTQAMIGNVLAVFGICISFLVILVLFAVLGTILMNMLTGILGPLLENLLNYGV